ncbi:MAG TPA: PHP domain-containing protein [Legionella sp.]|nr:PHP domain-containing protein [Legionella sp.]
MIDLHCHSHFSDGALSPDALLKKALHAGVCVLALTDHDTVAGLQPLHEAACGADITLINGIELSTRWKKHDVHILGLNITPDNPHLCALIAQQNERRIARAQAISTCLVESGVKDAYQKACEVAGHARVGRPHFAEVLVQEGLAVDIAAAFKRFLGRGCSAYVQTEWVSIPEAVAGIVQAGGQAVVAHPLKYKLTRSKLHALIDLFKEAGGCGIEVVSGEMTVTQITELAGICLRFDLQASTGSDYHHDLSRTGLGRQRPLPLNCTPIWHQWTI